MSLSHFLHSNNDYKVYKMHYKTTIAVLLGEPSPALFIAKTRYSGSVYSVLVK